MRAATRREWSGAAVRAGGALSTALVFGCAPEVAATIVRAGNDPAPLFEAYDPARTLAVLALVPDLLARARALTAFGAASARDFRLRCSLCELEDEDLVLELRKRLSI